ncbi:MAG: hypothetical protein ACPKM0_00985 [Pleomorphochaeta sp.]
MKKLISILFISILFINNIFSSPTIKGDFSLYSYLNFDNEFNSTLTSTSEINLYLNSSSNNVKYTLKDNILITTSTSNNIEQAYLKFRIPYKENYLIFNFGKIPLDIGGDWTFNSGTPFETYENLSTLEEADNPWIASINTKLYKNDNFQSLNFELIAKLPIEEDDAKIGGRLYYDINNEHFGTIETSFLTDYSESILCGGLNGTLYFDYGIYAKVDIQNPEDFETSIYLLKLIEDYTMKFEALYDNESTTFYILPTLSYNLSQKSVAYISLPSIYDTQSWTLTPTIYLNQNIVQGLDFTLSYYYSESVNHTLAFSVTHNF